MKLVVTLMISYLAVVAGMYVLQRKLQYHPENSGQMPGDVGISGASVETLATPDGENIIVWYSPAVGTQPTIIYFHGNAGEIAGRPLRFKYYQSRGFGVAYVSYRGFGKSTGSPTEAGLITDAVTAYDWLSGKNIRPQSIVLLGESLGTGVAVQLAAMRGVGAVALEAPYTSTADVAFRAYWWLPVRLLMKDQFRSIDFIKRVKAPLLVIHGEDDTLIPLELGEKLFAAANEPKELVAIPGFGHDVLFEEATWAREAAFFEMNAR